MRDAMQGYRSYGLSERGEGNAAAARREVERQTAKDGHASLMCLADRVSGCQVQIKRILGSVQWLDDKALADGLSEIDFILSPDNPSGG